MTLSLLWPTFALVALIFVVLLVLLASRIRHIRANPPRREDFASRDAAGRYFQPVEAPASNLANLFETPVLYFALVPLLMITRHADHVQFVLAWLFVALRAVHSLIHVGSKRVNPRFFVYLAACIVLAAMWIKFAVEMAGAAATLSGTGAV